MKFIKTLKIDINKNNYETIPSVEFDKNARFLHVYLLNNSVPFDLTGCSVKIYAIKADNTEIFNNCKIIDYKKGFVEIELTEQMNAATGNMECELKIYSADGVLTTKTFFINISKSIIRAASITSTTEYNALTDALNKVQGIDNKADKVEVEEKFEEFGSQLETKAKETDLKVLESRMNNFTKLPQGSTTGDAELLDGRVGINGTTYGNIGENIRNTNKDILNSIKDGKTRLYFNWELGTIVSDGSNETSNTRVRTVDNIDFSSMNISEFYIKIPDGYSIIPIAYNKTSNECLFGNWTSDSHYYKPNYNYTYRFVVKKNDNISISLDIGSLFEFTYKEHVYADDIYDLVTEQINDINSCSYTTLSPAWKIGYYIKSDGGLQGNNTACITDDYFVYDNDIVKNEIILNDSDNSFNSLFKLGVIKYNLDGTYISGIYNFYSKSEIPNLEVGYKYRFALATETWEEFNETNMNADKLNKILIINKNSITRTLLNDINNIKGKIENINNKHYGKKANFLGDSITYGIASSVTYGKYLQEMWGLTTIRNYGIPGSTISEHSTSMAKRCLDMDNDSDLNFVLGGTNDFFRNIPLGEFYTVSDGVRNFSYDNSTFRGALNLLFKNMKVKFIGKEVICLLPLHRERYTDETGSQPTELEPNAIGLYFEEYVNAIREACNIWSVKYIDLYLKSGLQPNIPEIKNKYFGQGDGLHINKYGHKVVAECICNNM